MSHRQVLSTYNYDRDTAGFTPSCEQFKARDMVPMRAREYGGDEEAVVSNTQAGQF